MYLVDMAEHSMCQPGKPSPQGLSHFMSRPGSAAFQRVKSRGSLLRGVHLDADPLHQVGSDVARQLTVGRELANVEVYVAARPVGVSVLEQLLDDGDHLWHVVRRPGKVVGWEDVQLLLVLMEGLGVETGDLLGCLPLGQRGHDHLVAPRSPRLPDAYGLRR